LPRVPPKRLSAWCSCAEEALDESGDASGHGDGIVGVVPELAVQPQGRQAVGEAPGRDAESVGVARWHEAGPHAVGNRYICAGPQLWMSDMAAILATKYRVPRRLVPFWLVWLIGRFDPVVRGVLPDIGRSVEASTDKARRELGWTMRPVDETLLDAAASLIAHGFVAT
jgi:dihydroflavonol-4-reductase